jgi:hypothetical protein
MKNSGEGGNTMGGFSIEGEHIALVVAAASLFFEISKIKVNPITFILRWIGKRMFEPFDRRMDALEKTIDENEMDRIRWEILDFANSCRSHRRHTKDEFTHIISQNDKYHQLLDKYEMENGVFDVEYAYILQLYKRCQEQNDFL